MAAAIHAHAAAPSPGDPCFRGPHGVKTLLNFHNPLFEKTFFLMNKL